ncbi:MAG: cation-transporting P-type ATPase, partial [Anaerolineales bacterium]
MEYFQQTSQQTIQSLNSNLEKGLDPADAEKRLEQYGPNELVERGKKSTWMIFLDQFKEVMVIVLI